MQTKVGAAVRELMTTAQAAAALHRQPRTLNKWAFTKTGPVQPICVHGRLLWPSDEIAALTQGGR